MTIKFYEKNKPYYEFTNFYEGKPIITILPSKFQEDGEPIFDFEKEPIITEWKTAEQLFQACKFINHPTIVEEIMNCGSPRSALNLSKKHESKRLSYWFKINISVMKWVLEQKFKDGELLSKLVGTGNEELVEDSGANDAFWGNGADGKGRNELGKALMKLRKGFQ